MAQYEPCADGSTDQKEMTRMEIALILANLSLILSVGITLGWIAHRNTRARAN